MGGGLFGRRGKRVKINGGSFRVIAVYNFLSSHGIILNSAVIGFNSISPLYLGNPNSFALESSYLTLFLSKNWKIQQETPPVF